MSGQTTTTPAAQPLASPSEASYAPPPVDMSAPSLLTPDDAPIPVTPQGTAQAPYNPPLVDMSAPSLLGPDDAWDDPAPNLATRVASDIGEGIVSTPSRALRAIERTANATSGAAFDAANWLNTHILDLGQVTYDTHGSAKPWNWSIGYQSGMPDANDLLVPDAAIPGPSTTVTGGLIEGAAEFTVGMLGAGKFLRALGVAGDLTGAAGAAVRSVEGGISMAVAFDPHEQRLSDLVQAYPALENPVTEFLATHPDDGPGMARVRAGLEGLGLGAVTEGLMKGLSALRAHYAGDEAAALDHLQEPPGKLSEGPQGEPGATPQTDAQTGPASSQEVPGGVPDDGQGTLDLTGGGPGADSPRPAVEENPGAVVNGNGASDANPAPQARKLVSLTEDDLSRIREVQGNIARAPQDPNEFQALSGINTDAIEHEGDLPTIMDSLRTYYRDAQDEAIGGTPTGEENNFQPVRSFAQVKANVDRLADLVGENPQLLMQRMSNMAGNTQNLDSETRLYGDFMATIGDRLGRLAEAVDNPDAALPAGIADRGALVTQFAKHYELMANVQTTYRSIQTNTARALNAFKIGAKINPALLANIENPDDLFSGGMQNLQRLARNINLNKNNLPALAKTTRPGLVRRFLGALNEYWINSVLSGPQTHVANAIGNTLTAAMLPAERMMAGALHMATPAGRQEFLEGGLHYVGMVQSIRDALTLSAKALRLGDGILDPATGKAIEGGSRDAIRAENVGFKSTTLSGQVVNGLGSVIRLPSRLLTTEDEFFKQLVYRGAIRAGAMREAFQQGMWNDPQAFGEHVSKALDNATMDTGAAADQQALQMARYATFQNPLQAQTWGGGPTLGESIDRISNNHPFLKLVIPFVRTPTNMMRYAWDRTPGLNMARSQYANDIFGLNGTTAAMAARAKMATGGLIWAGAIAAVLDGIVTGGGPADRESNHALRATGWQPYSIRVTNPDGSTTYRAYNRADPFASFLSLAADFAEVAVAHPEQDVDQTAFSLLTATMRNIENKTYISGLVRAVAALGDPEKRSMGALQGLAGGFVPSFAKQAVLDDDLMREARTIVDGMRARTPGYSAQLDPQRNILGNVVHTSPAWGPDWLSPIAETSHPAGAQPVTKEWRETPNDRPEDELARLFYKHGSAITPPPRNVGQIDLSAVRSDVTGKTAYDRLQELTGTLPIGGMTLRGRIAGTIKQPFYKKVLTDSDTIDQGSRLGALRSIIGGYRKAAMDALGKEQPLLGQAIMEERKRQGMARYQH